MKSPAPFLRTIALVALLFASLAPATGAANPAGYWEGAVTLPTTPLHVGVDLVRGAPDRWSGTISVPAQGIHDLILTNLSVKGVDVAFVLPGIPGDPTFKGALSADDKTLSGDFTQGGQTFPFTLTRRAVKPKVTGAATPAKGVAGKDFTGSWQGSLKPLPISELRLVLEVTNTAAGKLGATLVSLDQGNARIPVTTLTTNGPAIQLEVQNVGGSFDGKLSADGAEIAGEWSQGGQNLPLVFKRLPATNPPLRR